MKNTENGHKKLAQILWYLPLKEVEKEKMKMEILFTRKQGSAVTELIG